MCPCHAVAGYLSFDSSIPRSLTARVRVLLKSLYCCRKTLATSLFERAVERVVEDVAQRQQAYKVAALVDHNEAVHARFANCVEDGVEAVVERAGVDAGEVLGEGKLVDVLGVW